MMQNAEAVKYSDSVSGSIRNEHFKKRVKNVKGKKKTKIVKEPNYQKQKKAKNKKQDIKEKEDITEGGTKLRTHKD